MVSGGGTNLQALLDRSRDGSLAAEVVVVLSDRADAYGLERARKVGIPTHVVDYSGGGGGTAAGGPSKGSAAVDLYALDQAQKFLKNPDPEKRIERLRKLVAAESALIDAIDGYQPDYVCLAGFMRLLTPYFLGHFNRGEDLRVVNIHPALLPAFPGEHGYEDTFHYGCKWGGVTVHFVDEGEDTGPIIAQAVYPVWPDDDMEKVRKRGLELEYEIYAQCINWLAFGQVKMVPTDGKRRSRIIVTDPAYPQILKNWLLKAMLQN